MPNLTIEETHILDALNRIGAENRLYARPKISPTFQKNNNHQSQNYRLPMYSESTIRKLLDKATFQESQIKVTEKKYELKKVYPIMVNSMPKSGTHLLTKALSSFSEISSSGVWIEHGTSKKYQTDNRIKNITIPIGIDYPQQVNLSEIERELKKIGSGKFFVGHIPYSKELSDTIRKLGFKTFLILRDPRDVVVSHAGFVVREPTHFLHEKYKTFTESERILRSIIGIGRYNQSDTKLLNIYERYQSVLPWINESYNCTIFFEKLVGAKGRGSDKIQTEELKRIKKHLGITCGEDSINYIKANIFGGTRTFQKGVIGTWKKFFSNLHKDIFKDIAGELLLDLNFENDFNW